MPSLTDQTPRVSKETWVPPTVPVTSPPVIADPPPQYQPPHRTGLSGGRRFIVGLAIFFGVIAGVGLIEAIQNNDTKDRSGGVGGKPEQESTNPKADMDTDERYLYRNGSYYGCEPVAAGSLMDGAIAGITCDATGRGKDAPAQRVEYFKFRENARMADAFSSRLAFLRGSASGATVLEEHGWCLTSFSLPCYASDGRVVFYEKNGIVHAEWTYFPNKTYSTALRHDDNLAKMRGLWSSSGPE